MHGRFLQVFLQNRVCASKLKREAHMRLVCVFYISCDRGYEKHRNMRNKMRQNEKYSFLCSVFTVWDVRSTGITIITSISSITLINSINSPTALAS